MGETSNNNSSMYIINITPMSVYGDKSGNAKGVFTLPSKISKGLIKMGFDLMNSIDGEFIYNNITSPITITPKHKEKTYPALQFTVNDPTQFKQLKIDGANVLGDGYLGKKPDKSAYPALKCHITVRKASEGCKALVRIQVNEVIPSKCEDRATELMRKLLDNNRSFSAIANEDIILFESLSPWYDINTKIKDFKEVTHCIYIIFGSDKKDAKKKKLYVGIVGDEKKSSSGKRSLTQRLKEHIKEKPHIMFEKFRFFELKKFQYRNTPEFLKTMEMRIIQALSVLIPQNGDSSFEPLIENGKVEINEDHCSIELVNVANRYHEKY